MKFGMILRTVFLAAWLGIALSFGAAAQTVKIGETAVLTAGDSGNGNLLVAQEATLSQSAKIHSMSFYITSASGKLVLGVYSATGPSGGPWTLVAQTAAFTPSVGWNVASTTTTPTLAAGKYWLAYLPSSNGLSFVKENNTGNCRYYALNFTSTLPLTFSTNPQNCTPTTWSLYATLGTTATATPTLQLSDSPSTPSVPANAAVGTVATVLTASWSNGNPFTGTLSFVSPYRNDGGLFALSGNNVVVNGSLASLGNTTQEITLQAQQSSSVSLNIPIAVTSVSSGGRGGGAATNSILPSANNASANWKMAGMQSVGGIPNRTTVCATVNPIGGGSNDTTNIQNAINACAAGDFVSLAAGTFTISEGSYILISTGVSLRGAGAGSTILTRTGGAKLGSYTPGSSPSPMIVLSPVCWNDCQNSTNKTTALTANGVQGAYSVTVASATGFSAGQFVLIDEDMGGSWQTDPEGFSNKVWAAGTYPDYELVWPDHDPGMSCDNANGNLPTTSGGEGDWFSNLDRFTNEIKKIASISGNTITFDSPLTSNYRTSHTAQLYNFTTPFTQQAGVEDLTVQYSDYGAILFSSCAYCWANKVEATLFLGQGGFGAFAFVNSFRSQLEEVYAHKGVWPVEGGDGYNISICCGSSEILVENSISILANKVDVVQSSGAGSVFGYNYLDDGFISGTDAWVETGLNGSHMIGSHHILFEGNVAFDGDEDGTWGSVHYQTFFRNWFTGFRGPFGDYLNNNETINDLENLPGGNGPLRAASSMRYAYNNAWIGNVLGTSGDMSGWIYNGTWGGSSSILLLGYDSCNGTMDPEVAATADVDGNYDYVQDKVTWAASDTAHTLPNSLYLTQAPAFFSTGSGYPWPWTNPLGSPQVPTNCGPSRTNTCLPAKARYEAGTPFTQP